MKNLNLLFNKTYYSDMADTEAFNKAVIKRNEELFSTVFYDRDYTACPLKGCGSFLLKTRYPGLLVGTGYAHGLGYDNVSADINCGFSFDYVSGQPYIPGSSVKGILRSAFRKDELRAFIADFCAIGEDQVEAFENQIFGTSAEDDGEGDDVFLDAVIRCGDQNGHILGDDYITPHRSAIENPTPIRIIKILPDVVFEFRFILKDYEKDGVKVTVEQKLALFSELAQILGIGAKTNVGYGAMTPADESSVNVPTAPTPAPVTVDSTPAPTVVTAPPVQLPTDADIGKVFTAVVGKRKDPKNYYLTVNYNGSTFQGSLRLKGEAPTGEIEVIFSEISGKNYKFLLP
ncbi:MAG: type III-B CRISPR module RAMP protein Cmr6 [Ruminococcaceae bacterium]|nr:type III-B CRISPR module RAMP protein Cmr6 [Oscillospiraceae bacterium]